MSRHTIKTIVTEQVFDSRGTPTIKVTIDTNTASASFSVPSGASTGAHEAHELRDGDSDAYKGLGVDRAISRIHDNIAPALIGLNVADQKKIDAIMHELDGTPNKDFLGGNAMIGVSIACAKAAAASANIPVFEHLRTLAHIAPSDRRVPLLFLNLINGGKHTEQGPTFQEYQVIPSSDNVREAITQTKAIQTTLGEIIMRELGEGSMRLGDEGGFAPRIGSPHPPLQFLAEAIKTNGLSDSVRIGLDVAASSFFDPQKSYSVDDSQMTAAELAAYYDAIISEFNIFSIEDPFQEEDFASFAAIHKKYPDLRIIGDDLTVTNTARLSQAIDAESINALIIKPNQIGTLSETLDTMQLARKHGIECIVSHRSGETTDDFIADLAFAFRTFGLKAGAPGPKERMVKYDRLAEII